MYRIRFNLGRGPHFMWWQATLVNGRKIYIDPTAASLRLIDCKLRNQAGTAKKIHAGDNKTVCAWVDCKRFEIVDKVDNLNGLPAVRYNPRVVPHWVIDNYRFNFRCQNADGTVITKLITSGNKLAVTEW